jgi:hypothetical protein
MNTLGDVVIEHAKRHGAHCDTDLGIRLLGLKKPKDTWKPNAVNAAGNLYLAALCVIRKLQRELDAKPKRHQDGARAK